MSTTTTSHPADTAKVVTKVDSKGRTESARLVDRLRERLRVSDWLIAEAHFDRDMAERQLSDAWDALDWDVPDIPLDDAIRDLRQRVDDAATLPTPDASNPAQLRRAADVVVASSVGLPGQRNVLADALRAEADRLDADAADRAKAEEFARRLPFWGALNADGERHLIDALTEFHRAGRDAVKAGA